jgi:threonyl-tRNA synthetase
VWLAPVQAAVLPVADRHDGYAAEVVAVLTAAGLRAEADLRTESVGKKIAEAEHQRIPCILVVGDREAESGAVSVRRRGRGNLGARPLADVRDELAAEAASRSLDG